MDQTRRKLIVFGATALTVLLLDQLSKYWIRTTPDLHNYTLVEGWLAFNFTKNPGMALGIHWADTWVISLVAIAATVIILVYVWKTMKTAGLIYMACMGLIIGGALGNITDRFFMARVGGYGGVLDGHVVDFIHFKLRIGDFDVFPYIFNVADMAISVAIFTLILFYRQLMPESFGKREDAEGAPDAGTDASADAGTSLENDPDTPAGSQTAPDADPAASEDAIIKPAPDPNPTAPKSEDNTKIEVKRQAPSSTPDAEKKPDSRESKE